MADFPPVSYLSPLHVSLQKVGLTNAAFYGSPVTHDNPPHTFNIRLFEHLPALFLTLCSRVERY